MNRSARILLIDDHPAVRQGLALLLAQDQHQVCGEAGCRDELLQQLATCQADIALLDLLLGDQSGLDLIDDLREQGIPVLVYSMFEDAETIRQAFAFGAQGYVCKREVSDSLLNAVREVLEGGRHVSPFAAQSLSDSLLSPEALSGEVALSEREQEIIELLGRGCGNQDIADELKLSVRTIESYCARAIDKLGLDGMKELRRHAIKISRRSDSINR